MPKYAFELRPVVTASACWVAADVIVVVAVVTCAWSLVRAIVAARGVCVCVRRKFIARTRWRMMQGAGGSVWSGLAD